MKNLTKTKPKLIPIEVVGIRSAEMRKIMMLAGMNPDGPNFDFLRDIIKEHPQAEFTVTIRLPPDNFELVNLREVNGGQ